jgi:arylsulfatase A-like enzyme
MRLHHIGPKLDCLLQVRKRARIIFSGVIDFNSPNDPRQSPKEFVDMFPRDKIEIPPNFVPEFPFENGFLNRRDEQLAPFPRTHAAVRLHRSEYYAIIAYLDGQIGKILDALERSGKADNTYVIFTADHGLAVGQDGMMGKQSLFDHSIRMPWIIRSRGIPEGKRVDDLVYQHCTFATTCELAGIPIPKQVEFPSLVNLIEGKGPPKYHAVFSRYQDYQRTVRTRDYKLIVHPQVKKVQLFDMNKNPWELLTGDLAENTKMAPVRRRLMDQLRRYEEELGDPLVVGKPKPPWES